MDTTPDTPDTSAIGHPDAEPEDVPAGPHAMGSPGHRPAARPGCVPVSVGIVLVLVGVPMLVCPGPGVATIAAGLGMIAVGLGIKRREEDV
jgi:hypothetical protein